MFEQIVANSVLKRFSKIWQGKNLKKSKNKRKRRKTKRQIGKSPQKCRKTRFLSRTIAYHTRR